MKLMLLRKILGAELTEVKGDWRKLHYEELRNLYPSPSVKSGKMEINEMEVNGHVAWMREKRNVLRRPLGNCRHRG